MRTPLFALLLLPACSSTQLSTETASRDLTPPWLEVSTPLRGTLETGDRASVLVSGRVDDEGGGVRVLVNGSVARIQPDKSFSVPVSIRPGITLIHTIVTDGAGNQTRDTRAVLSGALVSAAAPVKDGIVARLDARSIRAGGDLLAQRLGATALAEATRKQNPLFNEPLACIGARADAMTVKHGAIKLVVDPTEGGLLVDADVPDVEVGLLVGYNDTCTSTRTVDGTVKATHFRMRGVVSLGVGGDGLVVAGREDTSAVLEGYRLDVKQLSAGTELRLEDGLYETLTSLVADELTRQLPSAVLPGLGAGDRQIDYGSNGVTLSLRPTQLRLTSTGAQLTIDSSVALRAGGEASYLPSVAPRPILDTTREVAVGLADDSLNQLASALWAAGALDQTLPGDELAGLFDTVELYPRLPPQLDARLGGGLDVVLGDVEAVFVKGGQTVARLSFSAELRADVSVTGRQMALSVSEPLVYVNPIVDARADTHVFKLADRARVQTFVTGKVVGLLGEMLSHVPLPAATGVMSVTSAYTYGSLNDVGYVVVTSDQ